MTDNNSSATPHPSVFLLAMVLMLVVGCSEGTSSPGDTGVESDAAITDATVADAGTVDVGVSDTGTVDAGTLDAGNADVGTTDAGQADAGASDAGTTDAGADAGTVEAVLTSRTFSIYAYTTGPGFGDSDNPQDSSSDSPSLTTRSLTGSGTASCNMVVPAQTITGNGSAQASLSGSLQLAGTQLSGGTFTILGNGAASVSGASDPCTGGGRAEMDGNVAMTIDVAAPTDLRLIASATCAGTGGEGTLQVMQKPSYVIIFSSSTTTDCVGGNVDQMLQLAPGTYYIFWRIRSLISACVGYGCNPSDPSSGPFTASASLQLNLSPTP